MSALTFTLDKVGNRIAQTHASASFGYDTFNRLAALYVNGTITGDYRSNALNQRAYKSTSAGATHYVHGPGGELLHEQGPVPTSYAWLGGHLLGIGPCTWRCARGFKTFRARPLRNRFLRAAQL
jgi:hypothetical protein